jgi:hypothetical protein
MIDYEVDRHARLYAPDVRAARGDGRAHCREVHEEGHAREVLKQDAPDNEGHLRRPRGVGTPPRERLDVLVPNSQAIHMT